MNPYLLGFRCLTCGELHSTADVTYTCPADGGNLDAVYDYARIGREVAPITLTASDDRSIWRFAPLLPAPMPRGLPTPLTMLGDTPLYRAPRLEAALDVRSIWLKDDSRLPSSSFKDRASAMVVAQAIAEGRTTICVASTGNAAGALAAMCSGTDRRAVVFVPQGTPEGKLAGITIHGATVYVVRGSYNDAVRLAAEACERFGWYNRSTGTNPYTREGKKTAGFEIAEQLARHGGSRTARPFRAPDVVIVPLGDGNILSGVHKGFRELAQLGWIERMPRFIGVTAVRAPSLARAFQRGDEAFEEIASDTIASGISVDTPCDGVAALRAIRTSGGTVIEAEDDDMLAAMSLLARDAGVFVEPACAAAYVGLQAARRANLIRSSDEVVLQLTGSGFKDIRSAVRAAPPPTVISSLADIAAA
jgi:threonine synthase